ncbi:porin family protein [Hahella chejuensis]|nr:porin family protein [Hahella chejuensis]
MLINQKTRRPLLILLIMWGLPAFAQDSVKSSSITATLKSLNATADYEQAYRLGSEQMENMEGDPEFDFYFGMAALQSGHYPEAQFMFERLTALYPDNDRFRLEYARTLFNLQQYGAAREQFLIVLAREPPPAVKDNIARFLAALDEREHERQRRWRGYIGLGGGYDSNINNATDERFVGLFELPDSAQETESGYAALRTSFAYEHPVSQLNAAKMEFDSQHKHNFENSDFDLDSARLSASWKYSRSRRELEAGASYQHVLLDTEDYQRNTGAFMQWREQWNAHLLTFFYAGVFIKDSFANPLLNNYQPLTGLSLLVPRARLLHTLSVFAGTENPREQDAASLAKDFYSLGYRLSYKLSPTLTPYLGYSGFFADYKAENPVFGEVRDDKSSQFNAGGEWKLTHELSALAELSYTDNQSNLDLYDYTRWRGEFRIRWRF